ncbi:MAG: helix-turn-helix domain-containing protein [Lachnospiraceae bacterium]|nr:helix-turn-helix domain-containing protein [Lachnospiraceae bacterium]
MKRTTKQPTMFYKWDDIPVLIDCKLAAAILGVSPETVRLACVKGELPAFKIGDTWRINKNRFMAYCGESVE